MILDELRRAAAEAAGAPEKMVWSRTRRFARYRQAAMRIAREEGCSAPEIGRAYDRDHTTVLYADRMAPPDVVEAVRSAWTGQAVLFPPMRSEGRGRSTTSA